MTISPSSIASTLGVGSGFDMIGLANQLAEAQFAARNQRLTEQSEALERRISTASSLKNMLSTFASSLGDRVRAGDLSAQPTIANSAVAKVSAPLGTTGKGTHQLEVTQLASAQTLLTPTYAKDEVVGSGTLTIRFGTVDGGNFTADGDQAALDIAIPADATLSTIASAINAKGSSVRAYVADTGSGAQLVLKGAEGATNGFVIEATEDNPGTVLSGPRGLEKLVWDPQNGDPARQPTTAQDAQYTLDGVQRTSQSNKITSAAPGLSLELTGLNIGQPTTIGFGDPKAAVTSAMQDMTTVLNDIAKELNAATNALSGDLARDSGARALRREFSALGSKVIMPNAPAGTPKTLSELGLAIERDGTFRLDGARLEKALTDNPEGVAAMFTVGLNGIYATIDRMARDNAISTNPASLAGSVKRYTTQSRQISEDLTELAEKQETLRASMVKRFSASEARVTASQSTLTFLQSQIDVWNAQKN